MKNAFAGYVVDSVNELKHVAWPTRKEVIRHTLIIIVAVAVAMLVVSVLDYGLGQIVNKFILK